MNVFMIDDDNSLMFVMYSVKMTVVLFSFNVLI